MNGPAGEMSPADVWDLWRPGKGALVLSGGEPFAQAGALADLCRLVRDTDASALILVYTGYRLDEILRGRDGTWVELLREIDVLVDGPYVQELQCDFPLAGSSNQRVFLLSDRVAPERVAHLRHANLQVDATRDGRVRLVGSGHRTMNMTALAESLTRYGIELV
jgi:anaerobic ribonucleoside-triphosphate reductase activating protein